MNTNLPDNQEKTETEAKFICPDGLNLDAFLAVVDTLGFQYRKESPCFQKDVYLDTPEYTLLKADAALRIRQRGETYTGTYKSSEKQQGVIFTRKESEWALSGDEIKLWTEEQKPTIPPAIIDMLNLHGQILRKVLVVETQRHTAIISGNNEFRAEFSLDEVTFRGHKGQKPYREIEIEMLNGQFEQFIKMTERLQNHLKLQPSIDSKYKKGLILVGKHAINISNFIANFIPP